MRINRKLDLGHQIFVANCAKANIGSIKSWKLYRQMVGDYTDVGATGVDFQNFKRDLMAYIRGGDAQLITEKFLHKKELWSSFFFDYDVDEYDQLSRVFWADPVARRNFACFGDVVSFDATYRTNRYKLVFVPFTGIDNHKKSVTFAAGLIAKEDVESYVWLLDNFKRAMGHEPTYIITDQDPAMRVAVPTVFKSARHRFCMWHIMSKVGDKVGSVVAKDQSFRRALNDVVWDESITIEEFESKWLGVMEAYGLSEHRWFRQMFDLRAFWILAFFRDLPMGGLLRTTSRSESQNSSFGGCTNCHASLVEFFFHFEGAIDCQRHKQAKLNAACEGHLPVVKTPLAIERYAAAVYTITVFYEVQAEIVAGCFDCSVVSSAVDGVLKRVGVEDTYGVANSRGDSKQVWNDFYSCVALARHSSDRIMELSRVLKELKLSFVNADTSIGTSIGKSGVVQAFGGVITSSNILVHPPTVAKNKGSGKRFKSAKELAAERAAKSTRECKTCHKFDGHDSRNCPLKDLFIK
ncbi:PREDICTED: protein FAR1-RELATED SEQUENCE 5-like [Ipomoea nil]|uniref:protein FAR1-RELATED SEQUENCE 5-like n=1 Tax=Ipomoea nil TaxID=35883 RepID=UPI0009012B62|nr:PREDICTED: protein FAR1-RELATED SEQUENCE 5-like [Ipomoea nil]